MRRLWGIPPLTRRLGTFTYEHRGVVFQLYRNGGMWGCEGFDPPSTLAERSAARKMESWVGELAWDNPVQVMHETGWLHLRRNATVRAVARDIDRELEMAMEADARRLEAKGLRLPIS